jgi:hypothetical protein
LQSRKRRIAKTFLTKTRGVFFLSGLARPLFPLRSVSFRGRFIIGRNFSPLRPSLLAPRRVSIPDAAAKHQREVISAPRGSKPRVGANPPADRTPLRGAPDRGRARLSSAPIFPAAQSASQLRGPPSGLRGESFAACKSGRRARESCPSPRAYSRPASPRSTICPPGEGSLRYRRYSQKAGLASFPVGSRSAPHSPRGTKGRLRG